MDLAIISIGQLKNNPLLKIQDDYKKRITNLGRGVGINNLVIKEGLVSKKSTVKERKSEEAKFLKKNILRKDYNIFLDETGDEISSLGIAKFFSEKSLDYSKIVFCIGGPDGFEKNILGQSNKIISFGKVTWPHMLIRIMLLEQIYRSITILKNHPYHRE